MIGSRRIVGLVGVALVTAGVVLLYTDGKQFVAADHCLDAGGSFDYATGECSFERQPRSPTPPLLSGSLLAGLGLAIVGVVTLNATRRRD